MRSAKTPELASPSRIEDRDGEIAELRAQIAELAAAIKHTRSDQLIVRERASCEQLDYKARTAAASSGQESIQSVKWTDVTFAR
jgi:hypothetical protein